MDHAIDPAVAQGVHLFNSQKFFEAHEALETVWLGAAGDDKRFLHGLIQIAAAFHHHTRQNSAGFRSLLEKGWKKLEGFGDAKQGLDVAGLRKQLQPWRDWLNGVHTHHVQAPPLPWIVTTSHESTRDHNVRSPGS
jgi:predicted metal-dependent hydrolase